MPNLVIHLLANSNPIHAQDLYSMLASEDGLGKNFTGVTRRGRTAARHELITNAFTFTTYANSGKAAAITNPAALQAAAEAFRDGKGGITPKAYRAAILYSLLLKVGDENRARDALNQLEKLYSQPELLAQSAEVIPLIASRKAKMDAEAEAKRVAAAAEAKRVAAEAEAKRVVAEAEAKRVAAEAEANRVVAEAEAKRVAAEAEAKRVAAEAEAKRVAAEAEAKRVAAEAEAKREAAEAEAKREAAEAEAKRVVAEAEVKRVAAEAEAEEAAEAKAKAKRAAEEAEKAEAEAKRAEEEAEKAEAEAKRAEEEAEEAEAEAERAAEEAEAKKPENVIEKLLNDMVAGAREVVGLNAAKTAQANHFMAELAKLNDASKALLHSKMEKVQAGERDERFGVVREVRNPLKRCFGVKEGNTKTWASMFRAAESVAPVVNPGPETEKDQTPNSPTKTA